MPRSLVEHRNESVWTRLTGAVVRALLAILVIATPSLLLSDITRDTAQIVALVALFAAVITFFEYVSVYPGLIEFRDAPPFNRVRYLALLAMVGLLSVLVRAPVEGSTFEQLVHVLAAALAQTIDFPFSPVRLLVQVLPPDAPVEQVEQLRLAAGMAYMISLVALAYFVVILRTIGWPICNGGFNVWVNLPTFDPTAGGDVVERLRRDAWVNTALGFLLPFLLPPALRIVSESFTPLSLASTHTMIWTVSAWAFLPASLFMRGIAMNRIAMMIDEKRRARSACADDLDVTAAALRRA